MAIGGINKNHTKRLLGVVEIAVDTRRRGRMAPSIVRANPGEFIRHFIRPYVASVRGRMAVNRFTVYSPLLDALHICATAGIDTQHVAFVDETWHGDAGAGFEGDHFVDVGGGVATQCHA